MKKKNDMKRLIKESFLSVGLQVTSFSILSKDEALQQFLLQERMLDAQTKQSGQVSLATNNLN